MYSFLRDKTATGQFDCPFPGTTPVQRQAKCAAANEKGNETTTSPSQFEL